MTSNSMPNHSPQNEWIAEQSSHAHLLTIDKMVHHCHLYGLNDQASAIKGSIKHLTETYLPNAITQEFQQKLKETLPNNAVYKINTLTLRVSLLHNALQGDFSLTNLSDTIANQLTDALAEQIANSANNNIAIFNNEAEFIASFISDLLLNRAWHTWLYQEFSPLRYLDNNEAIVQVLLSRKTDLPEIVKHVVSKQSLPRLLSVFTPEHGLRLFKLWCAPSYVETFNIHLISDTHALGAYLDKTKNWLTLAKQKTPKRHNNTSSELIIIQYLFAILAYKPLNFASLDTSHHFSNGKNTTLISNGNIDIATAMIVMSHMLFITKNLPVVKSLLARTNQNNDTENVSTHNIKYQNTRDEKIVEYLQKGIKQSDQYKDYIEDAVKIASSEIENQSVNQTPHTNARPEILEPKTTTKHPQENTLDDQSHIVMCDNAGLALLTPVILSLKLYEFFPIDTLRDAIYSIINNSDSKITHLEGEETNRTFLDSSSTWLNTLFSNSDDDNKENRLDDISSTSKKTIAEDSSIPNHLFFGLDKSQKSTLLEMKGLAQIRKLILMQFAARLSGLQHSSQTYLVKQFLSTPGYMSITPEVITVHIDPIPLNILLKMAGFSHWQETLPWLNKKLNIRVKEC